MWYAGYELHDESFVRFVAIRFAKPACFKFSVFNLDNSAVYDHKILMVIITPLNVFVITPQKVKYLLFGVDNWLKGQRSLLSHQFR